MDNKLVVSVAGCGWLGLPLAESLIISGYSVKGSTTSAEKLTTLKNMGIDPYLVHFGALPASEASGLLDCDVLIIAIPPGSRRAEGADNYREMARYFTAATRETNIRKIILVSSTAVYPETNSAASESEEARPETAAGVVLKEVEDQFLAIRDKTVVVLRLAGLVGPGRHPGRFFKGKQGIPNGWAPVNVIHRDDVIGIIKKIIEDDQTAGIYNGCSPVHPSKISFYGLAASLAGEPLPGFVEEEGRWKVISGARVALELRYEFIYPNLEDWLRQTASNDQDVVR